MKKKIFASIILLLLAIFLSEGITSYAAGVSGVSVKNNKGIEISTIDESYKMVTSVSYSAELAKKLEDVIDDSLELKETYEIYFHINNSNQYDLTDELDNPLLTVRIPIGEKYADSKTLQIYLYRGNFLQDLDFEIKDGYFEFHTVQLGQFVIVGRKATNQIFLWIAIVEGVIALGLSIYLIISIRNKRKIMFAQVNDVDNIEEKEHVEVKMVDKLPKKEDVDKEEELVQTESEEVKEEVESKDQDKVEEVKVESKESKKVKEDNVKVEVKADTNKVEPNKEQKVEEKPKTTGPKKKVKKLKTR